MGVPRQGMEGHLIRKNTDTRGVIIQSVGENVCRHKVGKVSYARSSGKQEIIFILELWDKQFIHKGFFHYSGEKKKTQPTVKRFAL